MPLREPKFKYDQTTLKVSGCGDHRRIDVTYLRCLRTKGVEVEEDSPIFQTESRENTEKLSQSVSRSRRIIQELAFCNPWEYFVTLTIDPERFNRSELENFMKTLCKYISNQNRLHNLQIKYLLIPELHKDGQSWHLHGFINGLPDRFLHRFAIGDTMGAQIAEKVKRGETVYNWPAYADKFGYCSLEPVKNPEAVSNYVTKYITKDLLNSVSQLNAHMYYHSRDLKKATLVKSGICYAQLDYTFENDYCKKVSFPYSDELLQELKESFINPLQIFADAVAPQRYNNQNNLILSGGDSY